MVTAVYRRWRQYNAVSPMESWRGKGLQKSVDGVVNAASGNGRNGRRGPRYRRIIMLKMQEHDADVIIIGAGVAGLACAGVLADNGLSVIILEARDRVGGRILTHYDEQEGFPIELGA